jgi:hypothetical protein
MPYDLVWYLPEHKADALASVKRLPDVEIRQRDLDRHLQGLRFCLDGAPMPNSDGRFSGKYGTCCLTNRLGTAGLLIGARRQPEGDPWLSAYCLISEMQPGLVGAYWLPHVWEDAYFARCIEEQRTAEEAGRVAALADRHERFADECRTVASALGPYLRSLSTPGIHTKIKQCLKICFQGRMSMQDLEKLQRWLSRMSPDGLEDPYAGLDPEEYARVCFSDIVRRKSLSLQEARA